MAESQTHTKNFVIASIHKYSIASIINTHTSHRFVHIWMAEFQTQCNHYKFSDSIHMYHNYNVSSIGIRNLNIRIVQK